MDSTGSATSKASQRTRTSFMYTWQHNNPTVGPCLECKNRASVTATAEQTRQGLACTIPRVSPLPCFRLSVGRARWGYGLGYADIKQRVCSIHVACGQYGR